MIHHTLVYEVPMSTETHDLAYAMFATDPDLLTHLNHVTEGRAQDHIETAWERDELGLATKYIDRAERMAEWLDPADTNEDDVNDFVAHMNQVRAEETIMFNLEDFFGKGI